MKQLIFFLQKEPSTSSDIKNKNDTAGIQTAKKEQANKDGINCTDKFCNYTSEYILKLFCLNAITRSKI